MCLNSVEDCFEVVSRLPVLLTGYNRLSYIARLQTVLCQYEIVDLCHVNLHGRSFRSTWRWLIIRLATILKHAKPIFNDCLRRKSRVDRSLIPLDDFPFKNKNRITDRYCTSFVIVTLSGDEAKHLSQRYHLRVLKSCSGVFGKVFIKVVGQIR